MPTTKMPARLSAWFHSLVRKFKKKWWLWMGWVVVELFKDEIFSSINSYLGSHSGRLYSLFLFMIRSWTAITFTVFGGTILILVVLAFIETRPATRPILEIPYNSWRSEGLYDLQDNIIGWELSVANTETRFQTIANNVQARLTFRHALGNKVDVHPAVWLISLPKRTFADRVSIGMGERARLLVSVRRNDAIADYTAVPPWPFHTDAKHRLEFGQWKVLIELSGDNVEAEFEGTLTLNANGHVDFKLES
jgi:hypothetical protein